MTIARNVSESIVTSSYMKINSKWVWPPVYVASLMKLKTMTLLQHKGGGAIPAGQALTGPLFKGDSKYFQLTKNQIKFMVNNRAEMERLGY